MRVRKTTFEKDLQEKESAFLKLTGEQRLQMMRKVADRMRDPNVNYELKDLRVKVVRNPPIT
jgi:hypothetical protein